MLGTLYCPAKVSEWSFSYSDEWLQSKTSFNLSCSMPLQEEPFIAELVYNYFSNLLPESSLRTVIARRLGVSEENSRALLESLGGECAGRISLYTEKKGEHGLEQTIPEYKALTLPKFVDLVNELPQRPFLVEKEGIRLSLAGAQQKLPIYYDGEIIAIPQGGLPSTHIVKPPMRDFPDTVANELFCMLLAKNMDFAVPDVMPLPFDDSFLFCISRYDRRLQKDGMQRLHQEDFCQALGLSAHQKYEADGGVNAGQCFHILQDFSAQPAKDRLSLLRMFIFNYCIGNMDAHGKNFSLLYTHAAPTLAPYYDLLSTIIYENTSDRLAMKIGRENRPDWIQERHWERFADEINIPFKTVRKHCLQIVKQLPEAAEKTAKQIQETWPQLYDEQQCIGKIITHIEKYTSKLAIRLN
nr:type II toxin-antitoxin system HipA family toxin [Desulfovibrio sp. JC010]